jgi:ribosomal protein S18 acetylase RimI-like enzyme
MVEIRQARSGDAGPVAELHVATWRAVYAGMLPDHVLLGLSSAAERSYWRRAIGSGPGLCSVHVAAAQDGEILGYGSAGPARPNGLPFEAEIYTLYVAPGHHERGLGRRLLHAMFDHLRDHGRDSAMLWVLAANPARFFYGAMGGTLAARRRERHFGAELDEEAYGWGDLNGLAGTREKARHGGAGGNA